MERRKSSAQAKVLQSCRLFVQLVKEATTELHSSVISNMEYLSQAEELACMRFLQKSGRCCREVASAAEDLFQSYAAEKASEEEPGFSESSIPSDVDVKYEHAIDETHENQRVVEGTVDVKYEHAIDETHENQQVVEGTEQNCEDYNDIIDNPEHKIPDLFTNNAMGTKDTGIGKVEDSKLNKLKENKTKTHHQSTRKAGKNGSAKIHTCSECNAVFKTGRALREHAQKQHGVAHQSKREPYVCDLCGKACKDVHVMYQHKMTHKMAYQCDTCGKRHATRYLLKCHARIHTGEKPYVCHICQKAFRTTTILRQHVYNKHTPNKEFQCDQCSAGYRYKHMLDTHKLKHTDIRPYSCSVCGKGFVEKAYYDLHVVQHTGVRDFVCDLCSATFCTKPGFKKHMRLVHAEQELTCEFCSKVFNHHSKLKIHMRVHTGEKKYSCKECGKQFAWRSVFQHHMRTHTGEKPYQCDICNRQFLCSGNLSKHKKTHE